MSRFNQVIDRMNTRSVKWDLTESLFKNDQVLPMWVADMDFQTPKAVTDAIAERAAHGIFGYTITDEKIHQSIQNWLSTQHDWDIDTKWLSFSPGVVPSLHTMIEALTDKEDPILIQTPVYPPFYDVIKKHERTIVKNPLQQQDGKYEIDFNDFEEKLKQGVKAFILCNPHNPVGRVWTKEELQKMADLCLKHDVLIFSDEIHADLVFPGHKHIPIASLSDDIAEATITCLSPTKTFNLAGLQVSYIVTPNAGYRKKINDQFGLQGIKMLNTLGITALEAAYDHGDEWLEELIGVLDDHKKYLIDTIHSHTDKVQVVEPEGTYLVWLDCRGLGLSHEELKTFMQEKAKVGLNDGASFGEEGEGFMRINIACPRPILEDGVHRILEAIDSKE
ncbi:MalY/PatB family protein [Pontibacillus yanchengensis]|uniref:cysteine-S-conjugate beta-lyase n=1 Tax=Pontibacillus yanchengensis Y32 TaxID=1385514 RepID=A0A0A2T8C4_9BACI|nr:PatB family C-S lyase [Pontibacillus yanchengensis]KGP72057.1 cystathionine beta-lyase [Pontibacillus yanchengensis Y32]